MIVAKPSRRRDSLRAMLKAIPHLRIIGQVDDCPSALRIISKHLVKLILLDCNLDDEEIWTLLQQIKTKWPQTRCLVLVETVQQQQMAKAAGADDVLASDFSIVDFLKTIERHLIEYDTSIDQIQASTQSLTVGL
jgi:DNA-binding NarL/FixJ family response regulator